MIEIITYLEDTFRLLEQYECFFVVLSLNKVEGGVCQLGQNDWNLVLVHLDLFIVHFVEWVALLGASILFRIFTSVFAWTSTASATGLLDRKKVGCDGRTTCDRSSFILGLNTWGSA